MVNDKLLMINDYTSATGTFFVVMILKDGTVLTQKMMVQR